MHLGTFEDQSEPIMDVSPQRWNPDQGDPRLWAPMYTVGRVYELLTTGLTDWAVTSTLATARAATRADVPMFVGQPAIWADGTSRPDHLRNVI